MRWYLKFFRSGTALLGAALLAAVAPSLRAAAEFGVSIHDPGIGVGELRQIAATGFKWVRLDFSWHTIEKRAGRFDFNRTDDFVERLEAAGLKAVIILNYGNPLYRDAANPANTQNRGDTDQFRQAYARWAAAVVLRYAGKGFLWEIWNEPNGTKFWGPQPSTTHYSALVRAAGAAIHARAPNERLIGPGTSTIDLHYLERCFRAGVLDSWYGVSVHPYRATAPETAGPGYTELRQLIARYAPAGRPVEIICSEWGYSSASPGIDETRQAEYLTAMFTLSREQNIPVTIWYDWQDDGRAETVENRFGLMRNRRDASGRLVPKPAWHAAKQFLSQL